MLGDEHPSTLISLNNMGFLLEQQGKLAEAEPYYREALESRRRVLGDTHTRTLYSANNMGVLLRLLGRFAEAERHHREALEGYDRLLGDEHGVQGGEHQDVRPDLHAPGLRQQPGEQRQGLEHLHRRGDEVLRGPQRLEAVVARHADLLDEVADLRPERGLGRELRREVQADLHGLTSPA